ncbi:hypothetical protein DY000_02007695 [Brassica cretica]|uniref:Uncharacterized protein n=1 Tax=Brassica cretica TaxID=69181 RepID=A0ABQ7BZE6_BRACR|nr:hypothetical protein DY000_02007695 [Brassica cretica]
MPVFLRSGPSASREEAVKKRNVRPLLIPVGISHSAAQKLATIEFPRCMLLQQEATIRLRGCWYG